MKSYSSPLLWTTQLFSMLKYGLQRSRADQASQESTSKQHTRCVAADHGRPASYAARQNKGDILHVLLVTPVHTHHVLLLYPVLVTVDLLHRLCSRLHSPSAQQSIASVLLEAVVSTKPT